MGDIVKHVADLGTELPEMGRIRLGVKSGRAMKAIDTFRFTSPDKDSIEALAERYGGEPRVWSDPKASPANQWEVITEADRIDVWLPPGALDVWYELWSGGGCQRRCDGELCHVPSYDAIEERPCICSARGELQCDPISRIKVLLPGVKLAGVWRLQSKGWTVAREMPTMVRLVESLMSISQRQEERGQAPIVTDVELVLTKRQSKGGQHKYVVPQLMPKATLDDVVAGTALTVGSMGLDSAGALTAGEPDVPALEPMVPEPDASSDEDDIVDAEVVDEQPAVLTFARKTDAIKAGYPSERVVRNETGVGERWRVIDE